MNSTQSIQPVELGISEFSTKIGIKKRKAMGSSFRCHKYSIALETQAQTKKTHIGINFIKHLFYFIEI